MTSRREFLAGTAAAGISVAIGNTFGFKPIQREPIPEALAETAPDDAQSIAQYGLMMLVSNGLISKMTTMERLEIEDIVERRFWTDIEREPNILLPVEGKEPKVFWAADHGLDDPMRGTPVGIKGTFYTKDSLHST